MRRDKIKYGDRIVYEDLNGNTLTIIAGKSFDGMNLADFNIKFGNVKSIERPNYQEIYNCEVLDKVEKKYLGALIRPFRDKVTHIKKNTVWNGDEFLVIAIKMDKSIVLPNFKKGTMYRKMKLNKEYTLEELGLCNQ